MNIHDNRRRFQNSQIGPAQPPMTATRTATDFEIMQQEHIEQLKAENTRLIRLIEVMSRGMQQMKFPPHELQGHICIAKDKLLSLLDFWQKNVKPLTGEKKEEEHMTCKNCRICAGCKKWEAKR